MGRSGRGGGAAPGRPLNALRRSYHLLRHGESLANVQGLIVSDPARGAEGYGLTLAGREQVLVTVRSIRDGGTLAPGLPVLSSPFRRALESARIAADELGSTVAVDERLRERHFGALELASDAHYQQVWDADRVDPGHRRWGVESVAEVAARMLAVVEDLERAEEDGPVLLVTHGDPASILIARVRGDLGRHRALGPLPTAGHRRLSPTG